MLRSIFFILGVALIGLQASPASAEQVCGEFGNPKSDSTKPHYALDRASLGRNRLVPRNLELV